MERARFAKTLACGKCNTRKTRIWKHCPWIFLVPVERRLEDTIHDLCFKLINAPDGSAEFQSIGSSLQTAIRQHIDRLRTRLAQYPFSPEHRTADE